MNILITGTNGYIGNHLSNTLDYDITCINRNICDMVNTQKVDDFFKDKYFDVVIHCASVGGSRLKEDTEEVLHQNIQMFLNLVKNRNHFDRLIHFGSGAQFMDTGEYGFSKRIIANIIEEIDNFYNIIIYGLFDENEISTRFIKSCITRCLNGENIVVNENKFMDFFHMNDLVILVEHYITVGTPMKSVECCYNTKMTLKDIAHKIKDICNSDVDIDYTDTELKYYTGENTEYLNKIINGNFVDRLEDNIQKVIKKLFIN